MKTSQRLSQLDQFFLKTSPQFIFSKAAGEGLHFQVPHPKMPLHLGPAEACPQGLARMKEFSLASDDGSRWRIDMAGLKGAMELITPGHYLPVRILNGQVAIMYVEGSTSAAAPASTSEAPLELPAQMPPSVRQEIPVLPSTELFNPQTRELRKMQYNAARSCTEVSARLKGHGGPLEVYSGVTFLGYIFPEDIFQQRFHHAVVHGPIRYSSLLPGLWHGDHNPFHTDNKFHDDTIYRVSDPQSRDRSQPFFAVSATPAPCIEALLLDIDGYAFNRAEHAGEEQALEDARDQGVNLLGMRIVSEPSTPLIDGQEPSNP